MFPEQILADRVLIVRVGVGVVMPVFRYFLVMGCCLLGLIVAAGWMWPNTAIPESMQAPMASASTGSASAKLASTSLASMSLPSISPASTSLASTSLGSLDDWRRSEGRLDRRKPDQAIVYPDVATLAPTADRLQWERQLRYLPENHVYEARAEMPKGTAVTPPKVAEKTAPRKHVAHARSNARTAATVERSSRLLYARNNGWGRPFGLFD